MVALAIALLGVASLPGDATAQTKSREYCEYPGAKQEPGACSFDRDCMPPSAGKCQRVRDQRWSVRCTAFGTIDFGPQPGWEDFCRQEAAVRGVAVPPPRQGPRPVATPTPAPTPTATPTPPRGGADPDAPGGQTPSNPGPAGGAQPPGGTSPDGGYSTPKPDEDTTAGSEAVDALEKESIACFMYPFAENCRKYWTPRRGYPLSHYELDDYAESDTFEPSTWFPAVLQWLNTVIWYALLQLIDGALKLLEWAFNQRLFGSEGDRGWITNTELEQTLRDIFGALGGSWMVLGILIAAGWGVWNGLVRQRTIQTLGGLLATLALMVGALVVITAPEKTIGELTNLIDDGAKAGFAIASTASADDLDQAQVDAQQGVFTALVQVPWSALQFGDPAKGRETAEWDGIDGEETLAAGYLKHPIDKSIGNAFSDDNTGSLLPPRMTTYSRLEDHAEQYTVLQELEGAMSRFGLLLLIAAGLIAAVALLLSVGIKLIMASIEVLVLILFLPAMMIAPAFGETGRNASLEYVKRVVERVMAKWVYSIFFGIVVLGSNMISKLELGFYDRWWLMLAYWWGMLLKREEILSLLFLDPQGRRSGGGGRSSGFGLFGAAVQYRAFRQVAGDAMRIGKKVAGGAAAGPLALGKVMQRDHDRHNEAVGRRNANDAQHQLRDRFGRAHDARRGQAQAALSERDQKRQQLRQNQQRQREIGKERNDLTGQLRAKKGNPAAPPKWLQTRFDKLDAEEGKLRSGADALHSELDDPRYRAAERFMSTHGDGPLVQSEREFHAAADQRRAELELRPDDDVNLISAGVDPDQYRANVAAAHGTGGFARHSRAEADRQLAESAAAMTRDRELINALEDRSGDRYRSLPDGGTGDSGRDYRSARRQIREERSESRARDRIFRR